MAGLWWDEEDADYVRRRSDRYPGALNRAGMDLGGSHRSTGDRARSRSKEPHRRDPSDRLLTGCGIRSHGDRRPVDWAGITAWKAREVDLRSYLEGEVASDD